jgi:glycosyltransferase involved in cell wall biosynthesis
VQRIGAQDVFFVGWRDHDVLAEMLRCSDVFAAPAVNEPFGLVYLEAMAASVPPIATASGGPLSFINVDSEQPTGWLVAPDDGRALTAALAGAVADPTERRARGRRAARFARERYSWDTTAVRFGEIYGEVIDERARPLGGRLQASGVAYERRTL